MKKIESWKLGGIVGSLIGLILFFVITGEQFIDDILSLKKWIGFIIVILEPALAGALIGFVHHKIRNVKKNKILFWLAFILLILFLIFVTTIWFFVLDLATGIF